ncbi:MAG: UDP-N-acetylmuramate dehydrogenase [Oscillospiraceae bacterium]|jgi:UDP-N-acetylmuramate dehydrogenase|nr:UDP-N-acetylmuramate dehydrogenase [Oscillospiraceae bacterium]
MEALIQYAAEAGFSALKDAALCDYTSFKIGGPADLLLLPQTPEHCANILRISQSEGVPLTLLGNGSNVLAPDEGLRGAVLCTAALRGIRLAGNNTVLCAAGEKLATLCSFALENSLAGLAFAYGIPGSAGGAAFMNAGAYGGEMRDVLHAVKYLTPDGTLAQLEGDALDLGYRHSAFSENGGLILALELTLQPGDKKEIRAAMDDFLTRRKTKQPLEYPSAGSVFKRPEGDYAGRLIQEAGLRGFNIGGAQVSEKHAGFIVNTGGATCADVLALVEYIQETVQLVSGVLLETEIITIKN